jgi:hypothetical protein
MLGSLGSAAKRTAPFSTYKELSIAAAFARSVGAPFLG